MVSRQVYLLQNDRSSTFSQMGPFNQYLHNFAAYSSNKLMEKSKDISTVKKGFQPQMMTGAQFSFATLSENTMG